MVPTPCLKYKTKISLHTEQKQKKKNKKKKKTHLHSSIMKEKEKEVSDQNPGNGCQGRRVGSSGTGMGLGVRSESEKEKTKMRERQRRAITTNIFHGLRKHGGYRLNPRADINEVLRELAKEAGWVIEPNGTTYRSNPSILNRCPVCGTLRSSTPTPTSSVVVGGGAGECSSADVNINGDIPMGLYVYGGGYESGVNVRESVSVCERDAIDGSGGGDGGSFNGGDVRTFAGSEGF